ncbi:MAG: HpcH/HpaI aldolase/citrate lyase family protein [Lachnospiraceae bacterium]|nr:HpcH/HpaI aldolase/citrate lyase family protein [Lachnospiraceae bacterium]
MEIRRECYEVGALLYCPALNEGLSDSIIHEKFGKHYSVALCLEDSVADAYVAKAEQQLYTTLLQIKEAENIFYHPKIFIRVRDPEQLDRVHDMLGGCRDIVMGYIFPKYTISNAPVYNRKIKAINKGRNKPFYMMPILESEDIIDYSSRRQILLNIKKMLDAVQEYVLNVRVGGNDFCNTFAARRHYDETIYDIKPIADVLTDILTVFSREYVVSGPVWEFFASDNNEWKDGLLREAKLDRLNGFVGKTVIHPKQICVVNEALKVSHKDYEDAGAILGWSDDNGLQVSKGAGGERMNELKTHGNWAMKTMILARIYGVG